MRFIDNMILNISGSITNIAYKPIHWMQDIFQTLQSHQNVFDENERLKKENRTLSNIIFQQKNEICELNEIKKILDTIIYTGDCGELIKVLGSVHNFPQSILYAFGSKEKTYKPNQIILANEGVIGKVFESNDRMLKITLITDHLSRVPVRLQKTGEQAILMGQGTKELRVIAIDHFQQNTLQKDDIFVTSGFDDVFPPDIPVAQISSIEDGEIFARPLADFRKLRFVTILPLKKKHVKK